MNNIQISIITLTKNDHLKELEDQKKIAESELEIENRKLDSLKKLKKDSSILIPGDALKGLRKRLKKNIDTTVQ